MPYLCWRETGVGYNTLSVTKLEIKQNHMSLLWLKLLKDNGNLFLYNQYYLSSTSISIFYACYHFTILFWIQLFPIQIHWCYCKYVVQSTPTELHSLHCSQRSHNSIYQTYIHSLFTRAWADPFEYRSGALPQLFPLKQFLCDSYVIWWVKILNRFFEFKK